MFSKPINFIREVKAELSKVSWSTRSEVRDSTIVVITTTLILGAFIGFIDLILSKGLTILFR